MSPIPPGCSDCACAGGGGGGCPCIAGVQNISADATIDLADGEIIVYDGGGLDTLTAPTWALGTTFEIHNDTGSVDAVNGEIFIEAVGADGFQSEGGSFAFQGPFSLPPGYAYRFIAVETDIWDIEVIHESRLQGGMPSLPYGGQRVTVLYASSEGVAYYADAIYEGVATGWHVVAFGEAANFTDQGDFTTATSFAALPNPIDITVNIAGTYDVTQQARMYVFRNATVDRGGFMSFIAPGVVEDIQNCARSKGVPAASAGGPGDEDAFWQNTRRVDITGLGTLEATYRTLGAPGVTFQQRRMQLIPVRFA